MTEQTILNIGFGNRVLTSRVVAVLVPGSAPLRRLKQEADEKGMLGNGTHGRRCRSILLIDSGHVLLSAIHPDTLCRRMETLVCGNENDGNRVVTSRVVAVFTHGSASVNRMKNNAHRAGRLVDLTQGRKCRSMLLLDSGQILLTVVHPDTMSKRLPTLAGLMDTWKEEV
jgi:regulator of extracellular matrix RemA (YlzA/DUF370 family)